MIRQGTKIENHAISPRDENYSESMPRVLRRIGRVIPSFALLAIISCLGGRYIFHIPLEQLAVVAAVPCVVGFGITRVLNLAIPGPPRNDERVRPSVAFRFLVLLALLAAFIGSDFFISAGVYYALHLRNIVEGTLRIAASCTILAAGIILLAVVREVFPEFLNIFAFAALKLLMFPTRIADFLSGHGWGKTASWS
jgi:hypothetical protein